MKCERQHQRHPGSSSFRMHDSSVVFDTLALKPGHVFLDLGCGLGEYALHAAKQVGKTGIVYAVDRSDLLIEDLERRAHLENIVNMTTITADITLSLPIENETVDRCLLATVLHIPDVVAKVELLCGEIRRVLKPNGRLVIIECYKKTLSFGPPEHMRLLPEEVKRIIEVYGFTLVAERDLGHNYLVDCVVTPCGVIHEPQQRAGID